MPPEGQGDHLRRRIYVLLSLAALCAAFVAVRMSDRMTPWWRHLVVDAMWAGFSLGAAIACFWVSRRLTEDTLKRAWWMFGAGTFAWFVGILEWTRLELIVGQLNPFPSLADLFFLAQPLFFMAGMALLRSDRRTLSLSLLQVGNVGLALVGVGIVITLALAQAVEQAGGSTLGTVVVAANVVLFGSDFLFGLYCLLLTPAAANLRRTLLPIVVGQGLNLLVVVAYFRAVLDSSYRVGTWLDVAWCALFSLVIVAAHEQYCQMTEESRNEGSRGSPRLTRLDSFIPALVVGGCLLASAPYWQNLVFLPAWVVALEGGMLAVCLGLHHTASRRILEELEESLRVAEARALEAQGLESMATLAGGLAHDFNNILTVIQGHVILMQLKPSDARGLETVEAAIAQGSELTRSLHSLVRRDNNGERELVEVRPVLTAVNHLVRSILGPNIRMEVQVEEGLPPIRMSSSQIQQALLNLALNARDAMPEGGALVLGARQREDDHGRHLELWLSDTGEGIEPDLHQSVFEPFFTTKPTGKGTGLGLAMVAQAVKDHGGEVRIDSILGHGTTFTLAIPFGPEELRPLRSASPAATAPAGSPQRGRVLVADDDPAVREVVGEFLRLKGWNVFLAHDGEEARRQVSEVAEWVAVITDINMPQVDGLELAREIRGSRPELPIILVSGDSALGQAAGVRLSWRLRKPLDLNELDRVLEQAVREATASESSSS